MTPQLVSVIMSDIARVNYDTDAEPKGKKKTKVKEGTMDDFVGWIKGGASNKK